MPSACFEPAMQGIKRPQVYALKPTATENGQSPYFDIKIYDIRC